MEEKIDLFKTCFSGTLLVKIENLGQLKVDSANQEEPLALFAGNAAAFLSKEPMFFDFDDPPWEIVSFSREKKELVIKNKNKN